MRVQGARTGEITGRAKGGHGSKNDGDNPTRKKPVRSEYANMKKDKQLRRTLRRRVRHPSAGKMWNRWIQLTGNSVAATNLG